jgi:hypothetical protein
MGDPEEKCFFRFAYLPGCLEKRGGGKAKRRKAKETQTPDQRRRWLPLCAFRHTSQILRVAVLALIAMIDHNGRTPKGMHRNLRAQSTDPRSVSLGTPLYKKSRAAAWRAGLLAHALILRPALPSSDG